MQVVRLNGARYKSYDILYMLLRRMQIEKLLPREIRALDATYGRGRWWRKAKRMLNVAVLGVDIRKHKWEVPPDRFYLGDAQDPKLLVRLGKEWQAVVLLVDPPWNHEKRGMLSAGTGISGMPYHVRVPSARIVGAALAAARELGVPLVYRYKRPIEGTSILFEARVSMFGNNGTVYYGVVGG